MQQTIELLKIEINDLKDREKNLLKLNDNLVQSFKQPILHNDKYEEITVLKKEIQDQQIKIQMLQDYNNTNRTERNNKEEFYQTEIIKYQEEILKNNILINDQIKMVETLQNLNENLKNEIESLNKDKLNNFKEITQLNENINLLNQNKTQAETFRNSQDIFEKYEIQNQLKQCKEEHLKQIYILESQINSLQKQHQIYIGNNQQNEDLSKEIQSKQKDTIQQYQNDNNKLQIQNKEMQEILASKNLQIQDLFKNIQEYDGYKQKYFKIQDMSEELIQVKQTKIQLQINNDQLKEELQNLNQKLHNTINSNISQIQFLKTDFQQQKDEFQTQKQYFLDQLENLRNKNSALVRENLNLEKRSNSRNSNYHNQSKQSIRRQSNLSRRDSFIQFNTFSDSNTTISTLNTVTSPKSNEQIKQQVQYLLQKLVFLWKAQQQFDKKGFQVAKNLLLIIEESKQLNYFDINNVAQKIYQEDKITSKVNINLCESEKQIKKPLRSNTNMINIKERKHSKERRKVF